MLYEASTSVEENLEIATWELLIFIEYEDMNKLKNEDYDDYYTFKRMHIEDRFTIYSAGRKNYPCSYLFMFRRFLLDQKPFSDVSISIFNYYVYKINIFISYLLLV